MWNERSHHPEHMKQACVSNTISVALLEEAEQTFKRRAIRNGYDNSYVDRVKQRKKTTQKQKESLPTLTIPYVSSGFTNDIKRAVKRSNLNVRIIQRPQSSLKNLLVQSRPHDKSCKDVSKCPICHNSSIPVQCSQKDVVYLINCDLCGRGYVGETRDLMSSAIKNTTAPQPIPQHHHIRTWLFPDTISSATLDRNQS